MVIKFKVVKVIDTNNDYSTFLKKHIFFSTLKFIIFKITKIQKIRQLNVQVFSPHLVLLDMKLI